MKIKEFVKKHKRVIKIAGIVTIVVVTNYKAYSYGSTNGVMHAAGRIADVLSKEERDDLINRLIESRIG